MSTVLSAVLSAHAAPVDGRGTGRDPGAGGVTHLRHADGR